MTYFSMRVFDVHSTMPNVLLQVVHPLARP